jgi:hypothetical protein
MTKVYELNIRNSADFFQSVEHSLWMTYDAASVKANAKVLQLLAEGVNKDASWIAYYHEYGNPFECEITEMEVQGTVPYGWEYAG